MCQISWRSQVRKNQQSTGFNSEEVIDGFRISSSCGFVVTEAKLYLLEDWMDSKKYQNRLEVTPEVCIKKEKTVIDGGGVEDGGSFISF